MMNLADEVKNIKEQRKNMRKQPSGIRTKSKLEKYRDKIIGLREHGASFADIQLWLRKNARIKCHRSTIYRFFKKING